MRQVGILAAAGLIALEEGPGGSPKITRMQSASRRLAEIRGITVDVEKVVTNIVIFDISGTGKTSGTIAEHLAQNGILAIGFGNLMRMVTHLDVSTNDIDATIKKMRAIVEV